MVETPETPRQQRDVGPQHRIVVPSSIQMVSLLGSGDELMRVVEAAFPGVDVLVRGNEITLTGPPADMTLLERVVDELVAVVRTGQGLTVESVERTVAMLRDHTHDRPADVLTANILSNRGRTIRPKTLNQKRYVDAIDRHTITFAIGPAGTGKTYLAVAKAVQALQAKQVTRILLTRPAVEAGERLGFLPGTLSEKIDPYLRPLYDALHDMMDPSTIPRLMTEGTIEVAPLAYMRGRAQPVSTPVLTPSGFRPIGQLAVGDLVIGSDGEPTPVLGVYPQGAKDTYRVTAQDGASTLASGDHLWAVATGDDRRRGKPWRVVQTRDMVGRLRTAHHHSYELPLLTSPVELEPRDVPLDPYALGLLLGEGGLTGSTTPRISTTDLELEKAIPGTRARPHGRVDPVPDRVRAPGDLVTTENPVTGVLRGLGLVGTRSETKSVPEDYLLNSSTVRLALLQGLLDADGGPVNQRGRTCRIQYVTTSPRLREDVLFLVRSLGGVAYRRARPTARRSPGRARDCEVPYRHDAYVLDIRLPAGVAPFRLPSKSLPYDESGGGLPVRFVDRIEPAGVEESVCIQVAAADSLYVTEDFLLTHNTLNDAFVILDEAQNTSPEQMKMFLTRLGFGSRMVVTGDVTQIDLPTGTHSGLKVVEGILSGIEDVHFIRLSSHDVVRHRLVGAIVDAYSRYDAEQQAGRPPQDRRRPGRRP
jgi:phosphate starvation-inducible protein PhoH and related proteins